MRLRAIAELYQQLLASNTLGELSLDEVMATLIDAEWEDRQKRKITGLIKLAGFRQQGAATNTDYHPERGLDKTLMGRLLSLNFARKAENLIITSPTGTGKSWLGQAIGRQACLMGGLKTRYFVTARFFDVAKCRGSAVFLSADHEYSPPLLGDERFKLGRFCCGFSGKKD